MRWRCSPWRRLSGCCRRSCRTGPRRTKRAPSIDDRLPRSAAKRAAWVQQIGEDGHHLLAALAAPATPDWLRHLPAAEMLRRVWVQQFYLADGQVRWRSERDGIPPAAQFISSPYDADARLACKGSTSWIGYKVHLSETCDEGRPRIITEVQTTAGPVADGDVMKPIHTALADKGLLPAQHIVDTGYLSARQRVQAQRDFGLDLVGPARIDTSWQAKAGKGFAMEAFSIDGGLQHRLGRPAGHLSHGCAQLQLVADDRGWDSRGQGEVLRDGLPGLPAPERLCWSDRGAAGHNLQDAGRIHRFASGTPAADDVRVPQPLRPAGRD
jgi:hypothetical protein